ncbi:MAG: hypothetical protein Kow0099_22690 [Candidatus Abyssubacteria bacterium]
MRKFVGFLYVSVTLLVGIVMGSATAAMAEEDESELAKAAQNPVADLISVPFQNNFNFDVGPLDKTEYILNIQPVIPISLNEDWNVITRTIIPVVSEPAFLHDDVPGLPSYIPDDDRTTGLSDIQFTAFLSPAKSGKLIWGIGPVFQFPTATDEILGAEKWCAGPSAVALTIRGPWVIGGLINNIWSFAGDDDREDVNKFLAQPFVNYNLPKGWYLTSSPVITANWKADDSDDRWTVPVGGGIGKIVKIGKLPVNLQLQSFYNVEKPDLGADWSIRFQVQFLFPK